jgi:hypothetical protein
MVAIMVIPVDKSPDDEATNCRDYHDSENEEEHVRH